MKLVIGLGNPGEEYQNTRHNIGFLALDTWAKKRGLQFQREHDYLITRWKNNLVIKPLTYMNLSGLAVRRILHQYAQIEELLVIADDIYLPFGEVRLRKSGGDGGHNGLKSIIEVLQSQDFSRLRIGIQEPQQGALRDYVLSAFNTAEMAHLEKLLDEVSKLLDLFLVRDYKAMADYYSQHKKAYSGLEKTGVEDRRRNEND
jgi:PTH1 family peptidyl-tRNA hydrolase